VNRSSVCSLTSICLSIWRQWFPDCW
jgi:hypothetical protein